ncbi:hypothetical protein M8C21_031431 [Ambrosia artemisiifolia]|uniref:non-specific serine/threonine protein kinase n=1 Tax=Ambrosia artemisiifolia TaxID=4212 RepID=A0AAD5GZN6_AMBAR|nr:hypothetical protein M8C21_031431 [Ambrosia artemisiifolia]
MDLLMNSRLLMDAVHGVERRKIGWRKNAKYNVKVEMFLKNHEFLAPKWYSYAQVEMMTNSFKCKLGQGGFGTVYKGVLGNQNQVAVKVLNELKGDGEDFINEVASVGRTSHVNIVGLIGFCVEGRKKALIYDFMPNGSLERFIYNHDSSSSSQLGWEKLYQIAVGIARGLEYLHRGCSTRILHFDIKPHNILLDEDFCPKISDFGLAKLFREKESKISMSNLRGTPGYIAPELFSRNFGEVSHKSDVYSYGMMILEMVGGRKNIEVEVDHTSGEVQFGGRYLNVLHFLVLVIVGSAIILMMSIVVFIIWRLCKNNHFSYVSSKNKSFNLEDISLSCGVSVFSYEELEDATRNFDPSRELGDGGFGAVYYELAFRCLQYDSAMRPTMNEVLDVLMDIQAMGRTDTYNSTRHSQNVNVLPSYETNDAVVLLKDFLHSPISVTSEWQSNNSASTMLSSNEDRLSMKNDI